MNIFQNSNITCLRWYALRTKPRQESLALENLERQGYQSYLPLIQLRKRRRNRWTPVIEPLFPCYLFVHIDPEHTNIAPIRSTTGVTGLVRFGNALIPVPDDIIEFLKVSENPESGHHQTNKPLFKQGDKVEITEGPFAGLAGVYKMEKGHDRAMILIELLGRQNEVAVKLDLITARS